jgi:DNA-binding NtrC family response regulator
MPVVTPHVLIADDDASHCRLVEELLRERGYPTAIAQDSATLFGLIREKPFSVIVLDKNFGPEDGVALIPNILREAPGSRVLVVTGHEELEGAVSAMRKGAHGFLLKSQIERLPDEVDALHWHQHPGGAEASRMGLVGDSAAMLRVRHRISRMARADATVLVTGESGTGKELVARALHEQSARRGRPFVAVNCAAIPEALLESELFGHRRGAFTDAKGDRIGLFEACDGGTLFLDEIGEMPMGLQAKLLRVLQDREVRPLGATTPIKVDVRVVAATNRRLDQECAEQRFRSDLYYRISVLRIDLPPLRARREDIPALVTHFLAQLRTRTGRNIATPSSEVLRRICTAEWPGNVRELKNALERAVVLSTDGQLRCQDLFEHENGGTQEFREAPLPADLRFRVAKAAFERGYLSSLMEASNHNIALAARLSEQPRSQIYRLLERNRMLRRRKVSESKGPPRSA